MPKTKHENLLSHIIRISVNMHAFNYTGRLLWQQRMVGVAITLQRYYSKYWILRVTGSLLSSLTTTRAISHANFEVEGLLSLQLLTATAYLFLFLVATYLSQGSASQIQGKYDSQGTQRPTSNVSHRDPDPISDY